jgi:glycerol uptake facilitator-like aquaporin
VPSFIAAQFVGAALATALDIWFYGRVSTPAITPAADPVIATGEAEHVGSAL